MKSRVRAILSWPKSWLLGKAEDFTCCPALMHSMLKTVLWPLFLLVCSHTIAIKASSMVTRQFHCCRHWPLIRAYYSTHIWLNNCDGCGLETDRAWTNINYPRRESHKPGIISIASSCQGDWCTDQSTSTIGNIWQSVAGCDWSQVCGAGARLLTGVWDSTSALDQSMV